MQKESAMARAGDIPLNSGSGAFSPAGNPMHGEGGAARALSDNSIERDYQALLDAMDQGACIIEMIFDESGEPTDYLFLRVNQSFERQTGLQDAEGRTMRSFRPDHEEHWFQLYGRVARTGEPARFDNPAAALGRWYEVQAFRVGAPEQHRVAILFNDITKRKSSEEQLELYASEMGHRAKNMLTVAASLVQMTKGATVKDYKANLLGRINALAHSQRLLLQDGEERVDLAQLLSDEASAHQADGEMRLSWTGPALLLEPGVAQSVVMAVHELATNAAKYGALSVPEGNVRIEWTNDAGHLHLRWRESGGPEVHGKPETHGLGTGIIMKCAQNIFGQGRVDFDWRPDGLVCELVIPMNAHP